MKKPIIKNEKPVPLNLTCTAYSIAKASPTTAQGYQIDIVDGIVVKVTEVTKSRDQPIFGITQIINCLWAVMRVQKTASFEAVKSGK